MGIGSEHAYANQSARFMMQVFPELEEASNIVFSPPSKKTLKRFRNVNPDPPRLGRSHWAHTILRDQISLNVREVAVSALQGMRAVGQETSKDSRESYVVAKQRGFTVKSLLSDKVARREIIDDLLEQRIWVGK
jgi:hypothetical protein